MQRTSRGFTLIELLVVIAVIGILATIGVISYDSIQSGQRDDERSSKTAIIVEALEKYYEKNGEYPSCANMTAASNTVTTVTLTGMDPNVLTTPGGVAGTNSFTSSCADVDPSSSDTFSYIGGINYYKLKYKEEISNTTISLSSRRHICPTGFILVPGSATYNTISFCVMKYEAKQFNSTTPISQASDLPWVNINQDDAIAYSPNVAGCTGCHLITEAEWLTIAQNVLGVASNWSGESVGGGYIYSGHNDGMPNSIKEAGTDDGNGYFGTDNTTPSNQRRTLTLSNGEVIWDLAGNVAEWTSLIVQSPVKQPGVIGFGPGWREWPNVIYTGTLPYNPSPFATGILGANNWNSAQGVGMVYSDSEETTSHSNVAGGSFNGNTTIIGDTVGVLGMNMYAVHNIGNEGVGFRVATPR